MTVAIIGSSIQYHALKAHFKNGETFHFENVLDVTGKFDVLFDFNYNNTNAYNENLIKAANYIFVNSVIDTIPYFNRFNGWNTFYEKTPIEISITNENGMQVLTELGIVYKAIPNIIGMITPRIVSMIVNEAFFALQEKVSTEQEIDTAMKLGTNYPYGPFEWSKLIGLDNIYNLLLILSKQNERYNPAPAMLMALNK